MRKAADAAARTLPYQERLKRYHAEKDEMFRKYRNCSAEELQKKHDELVRKWGV